MTKHLSEINVSAYQYLISTQDRFKQICTPLFNLGIHNFMYIKIFKEGQYIMLANDNSDFTKTHFDTVKNQGLILTNKLSQLPENKYSYFLPSLNVEDFNKKKDYIFHLLYDFNFWNCLGILTNNIDFVENYWFFMTRDHVNTNQFYLDNILLLERFIDYFNEEAKDLIDTTNKSKLAYFEQQFNFSNVSEEGLFAQKVKKFLEETRVRSMLVKGKNKEVRLSTRQLDCLQYLALGNSVKEIANHLDLSPRTIETHLNHIKQKTGYYSRSQLVTNFVKNNHSNFAMHR